jgi:uncharacterized protein (DUF885 family)
LRRGKIVGESIIPAFTRARALLQDQLLLARSDAGIWRFPRGEEAYAYDLRRSTTTEMTADQIHQLGLKEVARIEREMDRPASAARLQRRDDTAKDG